MKKHNGYKEAAETISLVQAAAGGDQAAFKRLHDKYTQGLDWLLSNSLKNPGDVEEAIQDTWIRIYLKLSEYNPKRASFKTWLYTFAIRAAEDMRRKNQAQQRDERQTDYLNQVVAQGEDGSEQTFLEIIPNSTPAPDKAIEDKELRRNIRGIIGRLGKGGKMLVLRDLMGLSIEEVAIKFGIKKTTVSSRLSEARKKFHQIAATNPKYREIFDAWLRLKGDKNDNESK